VANQEESPRCGSRKKGANPLARELVGARGLYLRQTVWGGCLYYTGGVPGGRPSIERERVFPQPLLQTRKGLPPKGEGGPCEKEKTSLLGKRGEFREKCFVPDLKKKGSQERGSLLFNMKRGERKLWGPKVKI